MKKLVGTLLALVMVLCLMTAVAEPLNLTMYFPVNVGGSAAALIDAMTQDFNTEHPDIHVEAVYTGNYDDTVTAIQSAIQGGNAPDLFVSLATQRFTMADGSIYSIPFQRSTMVMFYNKDAFREVGLDPEQPPKNWDELVEYGKKLTNDKRKGVGLALNSGSAQWGFTGFSLQNCTNGVGLMSADGKHVYFNTPENVEALQFWLDLQNKYEIMNKGIVQWTDLPTQFLAGEVAMIYHTTGNLTNIRNNATFDFGVCFLPAGRQWGAPTGGGNFYITNGISEERQKAAWEFIKFCCSTERAAQWSIDTGYVATRESCYETELLKNYYAEFPQALVAYEQLKYAQPELTTYSAAEMWRILNDNIQAAVTGEMTAEEALEAAQEQGDELLADYQ